MYYTMSLQHVSTLSCCNKRLLLEPQLCTDHLCIIVITSFSSVYSLYCRKYSSSKDQIILQLISTGRNSAVDILFL